MDKKETARLAEEMKERITPGLVEDISYKVSKHLEAQFDERIRNLEKLFATMQKTLDLYGSEWSEDKQEMVEMKKVMRAVEHGLNEMLELFGSLAKRIGSKVEVENAKSEDRLLDTLKDIPKTVEEAVRNIVEPRKEKVTPVEKKRRFLFWRR